MPAAHVVRGRTGDGPRKEHAAAAAPAAAAADQVLGPSWACQHFSCSVAQKRKLAPNGSPRRAPAGHSWLGAVVNGYCYPPPSGRQERLAVDNRRLTGKGERLQYWWPGMHRSDCTSEGVRDAIRQVLAEGCQSCGGRSLPVGNAMGACGCGQEESSYAIGALEGG